MARMERGLRSKNPGILEDSVFIGMDFLDEKGRINLFPVYQIAMEDNGNSKGREIFEIVDEDSEEENKKVHKCYWEDGYWDYHKDTDEWWMLGKNVWRSGKEVMAAKLVKKEKV